ncbi:MAG: integrase arm-type DNA-binding domain-containing protein, partial [Phenylobacterium sp.]|nr:integrase arm-type DNA-binding domain-containing protein [Phenylobacterium sp.]
MFFAFRETDSRAGVHRPNHRPNGGFRHRPNAENVSKMPDQRLALTDKILIGMPFARRGQIVVRDTEQPGFAVRIGASTKTFIIQADLRRDDGTRSTIKMKVCEVGELNTRAARAKARGLLLLIAAGEDPRPKKKVEILAAAKAAEKAEDEAARAAPLGVPTLREAWSRFRVSHLERKQRSPATIRGYTDHMERLFADWLDRPLSELGDEPRLLADRHDLISANNGPAIANGAMRTFRAVYNHARKTCRALPPENPAAAVDWNPEKRKDTAMGVIDLPGWFEQLARITNPIRREFHLMTLLSGSRPEVLKNVRVTDLDLKHRIMHLSKPKGGEMKAFDVPLSRA